MDVEQKARLYDILEAVRLIESYITGLSKDEFSRNIEKQDAVIRRIEIIGEATSHLSPQTRADLTTLPYRKMRGMRNIVAHEYTNVDISIVWEVATVHLKKRCVKLLRVTSKKPETPAGMRDFWGRLLPRQR